MFEKGSCGALLPGEAGWRGVWQGVPVHTAFSSAAGAMRHSPVLAWGSFHDVRMREKRGVARPTDPAKDEELLAILTANARTPLTEIAQRMGVSRATVQARLARLERDGMIAGYTVVPGRRATEEGRLAAIVLIELEVRRQGGIIAQLRKRQQIVSCDATSGPFDLCVRMACRGAAELDDLIDWIAGLEGVRRTSSSIVLSRKFER